MIYLDNAATTRPLDGLEQEAAQYLTQWYNPSALYAPAIEARDRMEEDRRMLLEAMGSSSHRLVFTSGGTENADMVLKGGISRRKNANLVVGGFEHPCVEESAKALVRQGVEVRFVPCDAHGRIAAQNVLDAVDAQTAMVCVMHVNNETGARNDVAGIASAVKIKHPRTLFFADGVQAFMRTSLLDTSCIDYYSVSAHKVHGLKGTGALFYLPKTPLKPLLDGGGQENGLRSGTENTFGIRCFARAAEHFRKHGVPIREGLELQYVQLREALTDVEDAVLISPREAEKRCSHILCISFPGVRGETLMHCLERRGIYISTGSACSSKKGKTRMEKVLGVSAEIANGAVRISLGAFNTMMEIEQVVEAVTQEVAALRTKMRKSE